MLIDQARFLKSEMRKLERSRYSVVWITSPLYAFSESDEMSYKLQYQPAELFIAMLSLVLILYNSYHACLYTGLVRLPTWSTSKTLSIITCAPTPLADSR